MDELTIRMLIVSVVMAAAGGVGYLTRSRPPRVGPIDGLPPGLTLLTSAGCDRCPPVAERLDQLVGRGGWTELTWEEHRPVFERAGIIEVPVVVVATSDGRQRSFVGNPPRRWWRRTASILERDGAAP